MENLKRFSDEYPSGTQFEADMIDIAEILNKDIIVRDIADLTGDYGAFIVVLAELDGKMIQFATGSKVIMPKIKKAKIDNKLPLIAKITEKLSEKKRKYFDIE